MSSRKDTSEHPSNPADRRDIWLRPRPVLWAVAILLIAAIFFDEPLSRALTSWPESVRAVFAWITRWGESDWVLLPTLAVAIIAFLVLRLPIWSYTNRWAIRALGAMSGFVFLGVGAPGLFTAIAKRVLGRARPVHIEELGPWSFQPIQWDWSLGSFPSGHTTTAFGFALVLVLLFGKAWRWTFAFAALIGLSRIVEGMHYLTDVAMGVAVGMIGAILVQRFFLSLNWVFREQDGVVRNRMLAPVKRCWHRLRTS